MRIGLHGFETHPWPGVERARQFYLQCVADCELAHIGQGHLDAAGGRFDAVISLVGGMEMRKHPATPILFAVHGGAVLNHLEFGWLLRPLNTTDVLMPTCSSDARLLRDAFVERAPIIRRLALPVAGAFRPLERRACRDRLNLAPDDLVVGFVARLIPQKNLHGFLKMFAEIKERLKPRRVRALIIGNYWASYPILPYRTSDYQHFIERLTRRLNLRDDLIHLSGGQTDSDLAVCYNSMDVLLHPTQTIDENFGFVPVEAMACGVPVVGSAYGGLKDTIDDGKSGYLFPTWNTPAGIRMDLAAGVHATIRLLRDETLRARMSRSATRHAETHYSPSACGAAVRASLEEAVALWRAGHGRPVQIRPRRRWPHERGFLPSVKRPWERYAGAVDYQVSGPPPTLVSQSRITALAPIRRSGDGRYQVLDPAWPASYALDSTSRELIRACQSEATAEALGFARRGVRQRLERLVRDGLLVVNGSSEAG